MSETISVDGGKVVVKPVGRLDVKASAALMDELKEPLEGATEVTFDLEQLDYISSAGLRVVLAAQKRMDKQGSMKIVNVNENILEVFEMTGFAAIFDIS